MTQREGPHPASQDDELSQLRREAKQIACRATGDSDLAEDIAQLALVRYWKQKCAKGVENPTGLIHETVKNLLRDNSRSQQRNRKLIAEYSESQDDEKYSTEYWSTVIDRIKYRLRIGSLTEQQIRYTFMRSMLFSRTPVHCREQNAELASVLTGKSREYLDKTISKSQKNIDHALRSQGDGLLTLNQMYAAFSTLSAISLDQEIFDIAVDFSRCLIEHLQETQKRFDWDKFMFSGAQRHEVYPDELVRQFIDSVNILYLTSLVPPDLFLLGNIAYLHALVSKKLTIQDIHNPEHLESFLLEILYHRPGMQQLDRWISIIALGLLHERFKYGIERASKHLGQIEIISFDDPVQRIGTAFAWTISEEREDQKDSIILDRVFNKLIPQNWVPGLSQLPMMLIASRMGSAYKDKGLWLKKDKEYIWDVIIKGLNSKSKFTTAAILRHLYYTSWYEIPPAALMEINATIHSLERSQNPVLIRYIRELPKPFRTESYR